jgi:hypothetical protein
MTFQECYPALWTLFGACFFVGSDEGLSDEEVLEEFLTHTGATEVVQARTELTRLIEADSSDWQEAAYQAWRYFETPAEIRTWLVQISEALAAER